MTKLIDFKKPKDRFARSINVERDQNSKAIDSWIPVGRAIDAISRIARSLNDDDLETAFSITGPYGSGKSSLAVILDALCSSSSDANYLAANSLLSDISPEVAKQIEKARISANAHERGFIRAVITAQREPTAVTVLRGLLRGAENYGDPVKGKSDYKKAVATIKKMLTEYESPSEKRPDAGSIKKLTAKLATAAPVLLLIDEFGKNLEAFADSHSDADLYLLQELAEATRGGDRIPLVLVTLQHMAFDEYAAGSKAGQRREWAKIQGRFEDIPFVDSAAQTRSLITAAFESPSEKILPTLTKWAKTQAAQMSELGLKDLAQEEELSSCWPLHPIAYAILPELCERYGQNERTLFSFLASREPGSVSTFLSDIDWNQESELPVVRLERIYDYFLESASNLVGVSDAASRWVEIDTRIRDAHGLNEASRKVLKSIGLLNLVSLGGSIRASEQLLKMICADGEKGTKTEQDVSARLKDLEELGLITYRDYADEYRIWRGSDFDLKAAIDIARNRVTEYRPADILNNILELKPQVAARHSYKTGTLRSFARKWVDSDAESLHPLTRSDKADGIAFYVLGDFPERNVIKTSEKDKPIALISNLDPKKLIEAAHEVAALKEVLDDSENLADDWVARRELIERKAEAQIALEHIAEELYGTNSITKSDWKYVSKSQRLRTLGKTTASQAISKISDLWYDLASNIRNDLINRHEVSSQVAKGRRLLLEAVIKASDKEQLGLKKDGAEVTLYRSVIQKHGLHQKKGKVWALHPPKKDDTLYECWAELERLLSESATERFPVNEIYAALSEPPYGIRDGLAPIFLVIELLLKQDQIALYEHGTFKPKFDDALLERFLKNPKNFAVKHFSSNTGTRKEFLEELTKNLQEENVSIFPSLTRKFGGKVLEVVSVLLSTFQSLPPYISRTKNLDQETLAVRQALLTATEPDELLFVTLPEQLGFKAITAKSTKIKSEELDNLTKKISKGIQTLNTAYEELLSEIRTILADFFHVNSDDELKETLKVRAIGLGEGIIDPRVKSLVVALSADLELDQWTEYVAMNVGGGTDPKNWVDDDYNRFKANIQELSGTFLRLEWLNAEKNLRNYGFTAVRVAVTHPDGQEKTNYVTIEVDKQEKVDDVLEKALKELKSIYQSEEAARNALLASLANFNTAASTTIRDTVKSENSKNSDSLKEVINE